MSFLRKLFERKAEREAEAKREAEQEAEAKRKAEQEAEAKRKAEQEAEAKRKAEQRPAQVVWEIEEEDEEYLRARFRQEVEKRKAEQEAEAKREAEQERAKRQQLNRMAELLANRDSASLPILRSFLEGALAELQGMPTRSFSLEGRHSARRLLTTVNGVSQLIAGAVKMMDSRGVSSFCIVATPHSGISSQIKESLVQQGVSGSKLACIAPDTGDEAESQVLASVKNGKHALLLADAYRLGSKWCIRDLGGVVENIAQAMLFLVDPECMTTLQIEQALDTIDTSRADKFSKDVLVLISAENARESESLRDIKEPEEPWTLELIMDNLAKAVHQNDCEELARQVHLLSHQSDPLAIWGLMESAMRLITPIYQQP